MLLTVLSLLSVLTVQGSGCDDFMKATVQNLQVSINREKTIGFPQVFPKNYVVSHYFNNSAVCEEPCCVLSDAVFLSNSWIKLLQHLSRVHLKYKLITELTYTLDKIAEKKFPETPDLTAFPSVELTPEALLSVTSSLFSRWLNLNCDFGWHHCIFPIPSQDDLEPEEVEDIGSTEQLDDQQPVIEGETGKRQLDHDPTSGYNELYFPGFFWWMLYILWTADQI